MSNRTEIQRGVIFNSRLLLIGLFILLLIASCMETIIDDYNLGTMKGQVYSINTPGPIHEGWTPPPLEEVSTIVIMNEEKKVTAEIKTNVKGSFTFQIPAGLYFLKVKESRIPNESGPFTLHKDETLTVEVFYDNGMR
jgi:hypothetical protein